MSDAFKKPRKTKRAPRGKPFEKGDPRAGRPKGTLNKATVEVREMARGLVESDEYVASVRVRVQLGTLPPAVETMLWHYAYGKPKELVELTGKDGQPLDSGVARVTFVLPDNGRRVVPRDEGKGAKKPKG